MTEPHGGIGEALKYYGIFSRYKPLIDQARAEYKASPELQAKAKAHWVAIQDEFRDSPAFAQLLATLPNILAEIKAVND